MWTVGYALILIWAQRLPVGVLALPGVGRVEYAGPPGGVALAPPRLDEPTALLRIVPMPTADLWDGLLRVGRPVRDTPPTQLRRWAPWSVPGALTLLLTAVGLGRSSLWTDELATWGMATTPWSQFWPVLRYVDAVLAPYYVFMHAWVDVFGDSDIALRAPSMLAMAAAAALIGAIGHRLAGASAGLTAGIVFAVLASTSRFASEARPYALTAFLACLATWLLVRAWDRPGVARWLAYGAAVTLLGWLHLIAILLIAGHAWTVLAWRRTHWRRFAVAAAFGVAASLAILVYGIDQRHQVAYIPPVGAGTLGQYSVVLFGGGAAALVLVGLALFSLPLRYPSAVFAAWAVLPALALVAVSVVVPMFLPRYLVYTTPGWALAAGVALARVRLSWMVAGITALAALALPAQVQMRGEAGHSQDTRAVALTVGRNVQQGDGVVYADDEPVGGWTTRDAIAHYLPAAYRPRDVLAIHPPRTGGQLLAVECPDVEACLVDNHRLWIVRTGELADPLSALGDSKEDLIRTDYQVDQVWHFTGMTLALLQRKPSPAEGMSHA